MTIGNFFLGLQGYGALRFRDMGIPRNALILSARLNLVPVANNGAAHEILIRAMTHKGRRATHWKRVAPVLAWQSDIWGTFHGFVRDGAGANVADLNPTGGATNSSFALNFEDIHGRDELAQQFTLSAPTEVADVNLELQRNGTVPGSVLVRIEGSKTEQAYSEPDGVVYASGSVLASTVPTGAGGLVVIGTGGTRVLQPGVYHVVLSRAGTAIDASNFISWRQRRAFFNAPAAKHRARAAGVGYGNYPGQADINSITTEPIEYVWTVPAAVIGITLGAIGIESVLQQVVDGPGYADGDPLGIVLFTVAQASNRRFATFDHATFKAPELIITYQARQRSGGGGGTEEDEDVLIASAFALMGDF